LTCWKPITFFYFSIFVSPVPITNIQNWLLCFKYRVTTKRNRHFQCFVDTMKKWNEMKWNQSIIDIAKILAWFLAYVFKLVRLSYKCSMCDPSVTWKTNMIIWSIPNILEHVVVSTCNSCCDAACEKRLTQRTFVTQSYKLKRHTLKKAYKYFGFINKILLLWNVDSVCFF
jgi:hypothetical protein